MVFPFPTWNGALATTAASAPIEATALKATVEDRREIKDNFMVESYCIGIVVVVEFVVDECKSVEMTLLGKSFSLCLTRIYYERRKIIGFLNLFPFFTNIDLKMTNHSWLSLEFMHEMTFSSPNNDKFVVPRLLFPNYKICPLGRAILIVVVLHEYEDRIRRFKNISAYKRPKWLTNFKLMPFSDRIMTHCSAQDY